VVISGIITGSAGNGVAGVAVQLNGAGQATTHTDAQGAYAFSGLGSPGQNSYSLNLPTLTNCTFAPSAANGIKASGTFNFTATGSGCPTGSQSSAGSVLDSLYTPHVFTKAFSYDDANHLVAFSTGGDIPQFVNGANVTNIAYMYQGIVESVESSFGELIHDRVVDPAGFIMQEIYGDIANTTAASSPDSNERPVSYSLSRAPGTAGNRAWTTYVRNGPGAPLPNAIDNTFQSVLTNLLYQRDLNGHPLLINDSAPANQWPAGAEPASARQLRYWDDYRLRDVTTTYAGPTSPADTFTPPYSSAENLR
jgi:hypothetical protein